MVALPHQIIVMQTPQTIAIIGIGAIGGGIAAGLFPGHDKVLLFDRDYEKARALVAALAIAHPHYNIEAIECAHTGVWEADIIILNTPCADMGEIADKIREVANQKVLIFVGAEPAHVQALFPNSKVVRSFDTIRPEDFEQPLINRQSLDCPIAGENEEAVDAAETLVRTLGFCPAVKRQTPR